MLVNGSDRKRHILKSITWRIIASGITFFVAWIITGKAEVAINIGIIEIVIKTIVYYAHERFWFKKIRFKNKGTK